MSFRKQTNKQINFCEYIYIGLEVSSRTANIEGTSSGEMVMLSPCPGARCGSHHRLFGARTELSGVLNTSAFHERNILCGRIEAPGM